MTIFGRSGRAAMRLSALLALAGAAVPGAGALPFGNGKGLNLPCGCGQVCRWADSPRVYQLH
jgi:hypothetical protein